MIEDKILEFFYLLAVRHGRRVLVLMACLTALAGLFIPRLEISSSYNDLVSSEDPEQAKFLKYLNEFGAADELIVVLEGEPETLKKAAGYFAREIGREKEFVKSVFYRIDPQAFLEHAPFFLPAGVLKEGVKAVSAHRPMIEEISRLKNLGSVLELIARSFDGGVAGLEADPASAPDALKATARFFREWRRWLADPGRTALDLLSDLLPSGSEEASLIESGGYLLSRDGRLLFIFVQPKSSCDDIAYLKPFSDAVRSACGRVFKERPSLRGEVKTAFTGLPAHVLTEVETINADVGKAAVISVALVIAILLLGFRSLKKIVLAVIPLVCGMVITVGLIALTLGRLNLISSSFLAVLFGIGIDFAIYLVRRTAEELGKGVPNSEAVRTAVELSGRSVLIGGLTTGLAFLAVGWSDFVGFSELGVTAGAGVIVVLLTTFLMLPALLLMTEIKPHRYNLAGIVRASRRRKRRRYLAAIILIAAVLCVFGVYSAARLTFDFNALKLLPRDAESTVYQLKMQEESDFQITCAVVTAKSLPELKRLVGRIRVLPGVSRVDSLAEMIPEDQPEKTRLLAGYRPYLSGLSLEFRPGDRSAEDYAGLLDALSQKFEEAQEAAFAAGQADVVEKLEENLSEIAGLKEALGGEDKGTALAGTGAFERKVFALGRRLSALLPVWLEAEPVTESAVPPELLSRFRSPGGIYAAYVFPRGSVWDIDCLDRFVTALKAVTPDVTGFCVTHRETSHMMVRGLLQALLYAVIIILVLLALDFRRPGPVLLALLPLGVGMLWVQAMMYLLKRNYDFSSLPALPLLLGLGIVYGVHIVGRWQEDPHITAFAASATSGQGVAFAALTTMAGLCSIIFSRHRGVSSFGVVILLGILSSLIAALYVLPAVIDFLYQSDIIKPSKNSGTIESTED